MLLEKAYAKLYGSYSALEAGDCRHSLVDLTGCPTVTYRFYDKSTQKMIRDGSLWDLLIDSYKQEFLLAAGTKEFPTENSLTGLIKEHAYSIIRLLEVKGEKLVNLRNPWGVFEWTGDWSIDSPLWSEELIDKVDPDL